MSLTYIDSEYLYGFHIQKLPSLYQTFKQVVSSSINAFQIYVSNSRSKSPPVIDVDDALKARELLRSADCYACIHGCLLYNLAGTTLGPSDPKFTSAVESTVTALVGELDLGVALGCGVVVHIGSCKDKKQGIRTIASLVERVLTEVQPSTEKVKRGMALQDIPKHRKVILENAAGEGTKIGSTLEEIAEILQTIDPSLRNQVKVCIDTAHAFGAGIYDWGKPGEVKRFYEDFDRLIGLEFLEVFHLNDSKVPFGSKKDRHECLGEGHIFSTEESLDELREFFLLARKHGIAIIGEPPRSGEDDREFVSWLMSSTDHPMDFF